MRCCDSALVGLTSAPQNDAITALTNIQSAAKLNHARAIYRAAQDAIVHVSMGSLEDRVATLAHLIKQYKTGLVELEADEAIIETNAQALSSDEIEASDNAVITVDFSDEARQIRAIEAVTDSLKVARDHETLALKTLISLAKDEGSDIEETNQQNIESVVQLQPVTKKTKKIALESFISDVVQQGLTYARQSDITLSLSYDMGTIALSETKASKIKNRMERWLGCLVNHVAANSEKGALAHIDMSATPAAVILSVSAPALPDALLQSAPDKDCVLHNYDADTEKLRLHLSLTEGAPLLKAPKMPVEEGIGARLDALLVSDQMLSDDLALPETNLLAFDPSVSKKRATS